MVPKIDDTYGDSMLVKASETIRVEEQSTIVLYVAKVGPQAYKDTTRFPDGPWCKEGDFVITRAYAGTRILIHGTEWRIINDDTVEAVVEDPRGIRRA
jgi:co-chaperonin GroES (HSP10)